MQNYTKIMTCGSVDDGKSTLMGRMLFDIGEVKSDQLREVSAESSDHAVDYSLFFDGLSAEREQGITIDVSYKYFTFCDKNYIIADAPGHEQYTKNMVSAAAETNVVIIVVDAFKGLRSQTLRHLQIAYLFKIPKVVFAINKMDTVGYCQEHFNKIVEEIKNHLSVMSMNFPHTSFIPVSAVHGCNVAFRSKNTGWFDKRILIEEIDEFRPQTTCSDEEFIFQVKNVQRHKGERVLLGVVNDGRIDVGQRIKVLPNGQPTKIQSIFVGFSDVKTIKKGRAGALVLDSQVDAGKGSIICAENVDIEVSSQFRAKVIWLGDLPLYRNSDFLFKQGARMMGVRATKYSGCLAIDEPALRSSTKLETNQIGVVDFISDTKIPIKSFEKNDRLGSFVLIDKETKLSVGVGLIEHSLRRGENVFRQKQNVSREQKERLSGQRAKIIWLTGLSGSGKSTIANLIEKELYNLDILSTILDGDNLRLGLNSDLGFEPHDRMENVRRTAEVAKLFLDAGITVIVALVSPFRRDRELARSLFKEGDFCEVHVDVSIEEAERRDPKGLYKKQD